MSKKSARNFSKMLGLAGAIFSTGTLAVLLSNYNSTKQANDSLAAASPKDYIVTVLPICPANSAKPNLVMQAGVKSYWRKSTSTTATPFDNYYGVNKQTIKSSDSEDKFQVYATYTPKGSTQAVVLRPFTSPLPSGMFAESDVPGNIASYTVSWVNKNTPATNDTTGLISLALPQNTAECSDIKTVKQILIQARDFSGTGGYYTVQGSETKPGVIKTSAGIERFDPRDWVEYTEYNDSGISNRIDLTGFTSIEFYMASRTNVGYIDIRIDSPAGPVIGTLKTKRTDSESKVYGMQSTSIKPTTGVHKLYLVARDVYDVARINWFVLK